VDDICVTHDQFAEVFGDSQSAAAGASEVADAQAPDGSSKPVVASPDTATSTTPTIEEEDADARGDTGDAQAPAVPAPEGGEDGGSAEAVTSTTEADYPSPAADAVSPSSTEAANDNQPVDPVPATGTE
jgi:hypothetical protein